MQVEMSRKVKLVADTLIKEISNDSFDAIALPVSSLAHTIRSARIYTMVVSVVISIDVLPVTVLISGAGALVNSMTSL